MCALCTSRLTATHTLPTPNVTAAGWIPTQYVCHCALLLLETDRWTRERGVREGEGKILKGWRSTLKHCGSGPLTVLIYAALHAVVGPARPTISMRVLSGLQRATLMIRVYVSMHEWRVKGGFMARQAPDRVQSVAWGLWGYFFQQHTSLPFHPHLKANAVTWIQYATHKDSQTKLI